MNIETLHFLVPGMFDSLGRWFFLAYAQSSGDHGSQMLHGMGIFTSVSPLESSHFSQINVGK